MLRFGTLTLDGLNELATASAHLRVEALERRCTTSGKLCGQRSGRGVDDLEGDLFSVMPVANQLEEMRLPLLQKLRLVLSLWKS